MRPTPGALALFFVTLLLGLVAGPDPAGATRLALIVGNNEALDPELDALRYADDDALRTAGLLALVSEDVRVLLRPDDETRALNEGIDWTAPTREAVLAAIDGLVAEGTRRAGAGEDVTLYFAYSGHGNYDAEGRGYLHLEGGRLTLRDLFHRLQQRAHRPYDQIGLPPDGTGLFAHALLPGRQRYRGMDCAESE